MRGKRVELSREDEQIAWLVRKGQATGTAVPGGFELLMKKTRDANGEERLIPRVNVCSQGKQTGRKRDAGRDHSTTHFAVIFEGLLRITDTNAFLQTLVQGIGPAKAFGFGLLSLARAAS